VQVGNALLGIFETNEGRLSKLVVEKHGELLQEALDLYTKEGEAKDAEEAAKALGVAQKAEDLAAYREKRARRDLKGGK